MALISDEIKDWEDRVYFGTSKFKEENSKKGSPFYERIREVSSAIDVGSFRIIACEYEIQTYKIPRMMIEEFNFSNSDFTFETGMHLESYIGNINGSKWALQEKVIEYLKKNKLEFKDKVVIIPSINFPFDEIIAFYFASQLEEYGAAGLIFSYEGNNSNSLMHKLALNNYNKMIQFPKTSIHNKPKKLTDDGL